MRDGIPLCPFKERLRFSAWLYALHHGEMPSNAAIGRAVERTGMAVSAWYEQDMPPSDWTLHAPLAAFLEVDERWLIRGEGQPPDMELWLRWCRERGMKASEPHSKIPMRSREAIGETRRRRGGTGRDGR